jgi:hypothetical protein
MGLINLPNWLFLGIFFHVLLTFVGNGNGVFVNFDDERFVAYGFYFLRFLGNFVLY